MLRLFIAVTLTAEAREACADEARRVERALGPQARAVRFPRPEGLHFTLQFLGWTPEEQVEPLRAALEAAAAGEPAFTVGLRGLQAFPGVRRPRVVYLGVVEGGEAMRRLAARVEDRLAPLGFAAETRPFTPHLTLCRVKDPKAAARIGERIAGLPARDVARFEVRNVSLMRSELNPGGSIYTELSAAPLGGERPGATP